MEQVRLHLIRVGLQLIVERKTTINVEEARPRWNDKRDYSLSPTEPDLLSVLGGCFGPGGVRRPKLRPQSNRIWLPSPLNGRPCQRFYVRYLLSL